jgi:TIR domain-containing protein
MPGTAQGRLLFFLSHSMKDGPAVQLLREHLDALSIDLYLAEHDPQPGVNIANKIITAIERSDAVVVLLTEAGAAAPFVQQEIGAARQAGKLIVPIVQEGVDTRTLAMLEGLERIDVDFARPSEALARVTSSLEPLIYRQAEAMRPAQPQASAATSAQIPLPVLVGLGLLALALLLALANK